MAHFGGSTMDDFLSPPPPSTSQNDQHAGHSWSESDFNSYLHQQQNSRQQQQQHHHQQQQQYNNNNNNDGPFNSNSLGAIYVSNIPLMSHPPPSQPQQPSITYDENGQPIKIRKKPGRKPNPASPALRKAQNRAAQRAFRERKERHLKDLEGTIRQLREQRNSAVKELNQTKNKMDSFRAENWYLKGVVLTLQFVCLHHNIHIPTHSPYLTEEALSEMAKTTPHAIEAYVNAYTRNNINLKPTMAAHFANAAPNDKDSPPANASKTTDRNNTTNEEEEEDDNDDNNNNNNRGDTEMLEEDDEEDDGYNQRRPSDINNSLSPESAYVKLEEEDDETMTQWVKQHNENKRKREKEEQEEKEKGEQDKQPNPSSISAIQRIRLQLRVQSAITNVGKSAVRLQPTILQLAIPHDPRIDLIPTPHMRDRMIIFRDQMDYDRCFAMLLNGALYHGGDPTMSASWELPAEFFTEFWYLAINYDVNRTNTWRRLKGLPELRNGPIHQHQEQQEQQQQQQHTEQWNNNNESQPPSAVFQNMQQDSFSSPPPSSSDTVWTDDVFAQMTAGMPTLQPLDSNHLTSGFDFGSPTAVMLDDPNHHLHYLHHPDSLDASHPLFEQLMGSSPESRHNRSPSIGAMMDLMNSLSTDMTNQQQQQH